MCHLLPPFLPTSLSFTPPLHDNFVCHSQVEIRPDEDGVMDVVSEEEEEEEEGTQFHVDMDQETPTPNEKDLNGFHSNELATPLTSSPPRLSPCLCQRQVMRNSTAETLDIHMTVLQQYILSRCYEDGKVEEEDEVDGLSDFVSLSPALAGKLITEEAVVLLQMLLKVFLSSLPSSLPPSLPLFSFFLPHLFYPSFFLTTAAGVTTLMCPPHRYFQTSFSQLTPYLMSSS